MGHNNMSNGSPRTSPEDHDERVRKALGGQSDEVQTRDSGNRWGPHDIPRWEDDPGLQRPALALGEPDEMRKGGVELGQTTHGIATEDFGEEGGSFSEFYRAPAAIRANAVRIHFARLIQPLLRTRDTTKTREAVEKAGGERADAQARRLEAETPRYEQEVKERRDELQDAERTREQQEQTLGQLRDGAAAVDPEETAGESEPRPTIAEKIGLTGRKLVPLMLAEVGIALVVLNSAILRAIPTTFPLESYVIAAMLALGLQLTAFCAGRLLAAVEFSQRLIAGLFVAGFAYALVRFIPALNLLREGSPKGTTTLTWVSVMVTTVAVATGWASALHEDFERRLAAFCAKPNRLAARWRARIAFGEQRVAEATAKAHDAEKLVTEAEAALAAHRDKIAELHGVVDDTPVRVLGERLTGEEAKADMTTEENIRDLMVDSEEQHANWLIRIARLSRLKTRSEVLLSALTATNVTSSRSANESSTMRRNGLLVAAVIALGVGATVGASTGSTVLLAAGVGIVAVLLGIWLWLQRSRFHLPPHVDKEAVKPLNERSVLGRWVNLPTRVEPRYSGPHVTDTEEVG